MLWKGWEKTKPGRHTGEAWLKARNSFLKRGGVQPDNGPAVVYSRAALVRREHSRRDATDAARFRSIESVFAIIDEGLDPDRRIDAQRALECAFQRLSPKDHRLFWEIANNSRPEDWRDYEQSAGISSAVRHKYVCTFRKRMQDILAAHGFAYLLKS